jgi:hypothetical protein
LLFNRETISFRQPCLIMSPTMSQLPEVRYLSPEQPGLEVFGMSANQYHNSKLPTYSHPLPVLVEREPQTSALPNSVHRTKWVRYWPLGGLVFVLILLAAVLGGVLGSRAAHTTSIPNNSTSTNMTSPTSSGNSTSSNLALNGTDIAFAYPQNGLDDLWLFYQTSDGDIRRIAHTSGSHQWRKPDNVMASATVAPKTPLSAINYLDENNLTLVRFQLVSKCCANSQTHLVYADNNGILQDLIWANNQNTPYNGSLAHAQIRIPISPIARQISIVIDPLNGTHVFASGMDSRVHEYFFDSSTQTWSDVYTFPNLNGYAATSPRSAGTLVTIHGINDDGSLQLWWKGFDKNSNKKWNVGDSSAKLTANSNSSVCAPYLASMAYYQTPTNSIASTSWYGSAVGEKWGNTFDTGIIGLENTAVVALSGLNGNNIDVFLQITGDDITRYTGPGAANSVYGLVETLPLDSLG